MTARPHLLPAYSPLRRSPSRRSPRRRSTPAGQEPADGHGPDRGHFDAPHTPHHHAVGATGRSKADAPEIDGEVHLRDASGLKPGDFVRVKVEDADEHDLYVVPV